MRLIELLNTLRMDTGFMSAVAAWETFQAKSSVYRDLAHSVDSRIIEALSNRGVARFYHHQALAIDASLGRENVVIATATASGKSLCYTVPVLQRLLEQPSGRALYLFPTKALAHDQLAETRILLSGGDIPIPIHSYDGDTPSHRRSNVRRATGILISNPDMLHSGILPQHTSWRALFTNLQYVVIDEIHTYRGIFGSHVNNVIRRLRRLCRFYGSDPQFICCSATIANPKEHAERLVEVPFKLINEEVNGAPTGLKHFILYNPPFIDEELGIRRSTILEAKDAGSTFISRGFQTVIFARARQTVELVLTYLQEEMDLLNKGRDSVVGYRGGYLPNERRAIEQGLRVGEIKGVVATNALELGIDIGHLSVAILTGYPGSIASTWQQAGRAGRRADASAVMLVAAGSPLDQYICQHPRYLFGNSPEYALCNPNNLRIMLNHLSCAAYELPFRPGDTYGNYGTIEELLEALIDEGLLYETNEQFHWLGEGVPAHKFSLRTSGDDTVVIQDISPREPVVIGEIDLDSVPLLTYEGAIYMHQARSYLVESMDWEGRIASVRAVDVDYYTRSSVGSNIRRLEASEESSDGSVKRAHGELLVVTKATGFRKIKRYSHETLGFGEIDLPEMELDTDGFWLIFEEKLTDKLIEAGILIRENDYGPNWQEQRERALKRDDYRCRTCGAEAKMGTSLHVHHIRAFRDYGYTPGLNDAYRLANNLDNLVTLCPTCHRRAEAGQRTRSALGGLAYVLGNLAPLFLMCDPRDIEVLAERRNPLTQLPTVVIYERIAAGVGFSERLYGIYHQLLESAAELVNDCRCRDGCPACVGPPGEIGPETKVVTRQLLGMVLGE